MDLLSDSDFWIRTGVFVLIASCTLYAWLSWRQERKKKDLPYRPIEAIKPERKN